MSDDEIKITVEGAFRPFSCVAKIDDYGEKLRLRVRGREKRVILEPAWCSLDLLRDESRLKDYLDACRTEIATGFCAELREEVDTFRLNIEAGEDPIGLQAVSRSLRGRLDELGNRWIKEFGLLADHDRSDLEEAIHKGLSSLREDLDEAEKRLRDKLSKN
jgi:hypothetical protein